MARKGSPTAAIRQALAKNREEGSISTKTAVLCLVGLALYWAWVWSLLITNMSGMGSIASEGLPPSAGEYVICALTLALLAAALRGTPVRRTMKIASGISSVLAPPGVILLTVGPALGIPSAGPIGLVGWIPIGVSDALLIVGWLSFYHHMDLRRAIISICLSSILCVPVLSLVNAVPGAASTVLVCALPILSALVLRLACRALDPLLSPAGAPDPAPDKCAPRDSTVAHPRRFGHLGRVIALIASFGLAFGTMQAFSYTEGGIVIPFWLRAVSICLGTVLALVVNLTFGTSRSSAIFRIALPLIACGFLVTPLAPEGSAIAGCLVIVGFRLFDIQSITILLRACALHDLPPVPTFCVGRLANVLGIFGGWVFVFAMAQLVALDVTAFASINAILLLLLMVTSGTLLDVDGDDASEAQAPGAGPGNTAASEAMPTGGRWKRQCDLVATQYGLSPRETEVLKLLAKGRDAAYIATVFVISPSTAKTHVHNVYKKLEIHSQQELISLVEQAGAILKDQNGHSPHQQG